MNSDNDTMNEPEVVPDRPIEPGESPIELSCPVCERFVPSPSPETCPHCQAPIQTILALLDTADLSLDEAMRDLRTGDLRSASKRLGLVKTTSKAHRFHVEIIQAVIDRLSGNPEGALARLKAVDEEIVVEESEKDLLTLLENVRRNCMHDQDALAACCEHYNYALFEARRGHFEESRRSLLKALNEVEWHADSHALLGKIYLALRDVDEAKYHLKRALASDPSNPTATRLLNDLTRSEKISFTKFSSAIGNWIVKSPAWAGSIVALVILVVIALTAVFSR